MQEEKKNSIVVVIVVIVLIGVIVWFMTQKKSADTDTDTLTVPTAPSVSTESFGNNPAEEVGSQIPDTNPLGGDRTNPFSGYKNPFE